MGDSQRTRGACRCRSPARLAADRLPRPGRQCRPRRRPHLHGDPRAAARRAAAATEDQRAGRDDRLQVRAAPARAGGSRIRTRREWPFFRALVQNLEMTLAKTSIEMVRESLVLVEDDRLWEPIAEEQARTVAAVLEIVEADDLLDRHPVVQRSIRFRNPYVDPMNAIQVELLRRYRLGDDTVVPPLLRSIAGIAAGLRNTGGERRSSERHEKPPPRSST